ncbi:MAG: histidine phosphatase family protein [Methylococcales bacterium]|nr:histidine phosphatase family protein [Methylococcales bacterium]
MPTTVDFLRHGEVEGGSYYRGCTDDLLTKKGWQQMKHAVAGGQWDQIISSPLHRCLDFAQELSQQTAIPLHVEPNWQEINFGHWEGKTAEQIGKTELAPFYQDPINNTPPRGEAYVHFQSRINQAWSELINRFPDQHVLVMTHAGVIRALFPLLLDLPVSKLFNLQVDHAGLTCFQCFHDSEPHFSSLVFHNIKTIS